MVKAFLGEGAIPYAMVYDQLGSFLALATYGSLIIALYGEGASRPTPASVIRKVAIFPPFIALVLAFLLRTYTYPIFVANLLETLAATLVPVVMIAVGYQLTLRLKKRLWLPCA